MVLAHEGLRPWVCGQRCLSLGAVCKEFWFSAWAGREVGDALGWKGATHPLLFSSRGRIELAKLLSWEKWSGAFGF